MANPFTIQKAESTHPGIRKTKDGWIFCVEANRNSDVELLLFDAGKQKVRQIVPLDEGTRRGDLRSVCVEIPEDSEIEYLYRIDGRERTDPRAVQLMAIQTGKKKRQLRAVLRALKSAERSGPQIPWSDTILYKLHVRGFTMGAGSGVRGKGTFSGISEKLSYFQELGVTSLVFQPCHETDDPDGRDFWGYSGTCYFAPRALYSETKDPVGEFSALVRTLHEADMECILEFYFPKDTAAGTVLDVLRHWVLHYDVDGFHLLGEGEWLAAAQQDAFLRDRKLLCDSIRVPETDNLALCDNRFKYTARRLLVGDANIAMGEVSWCLRRGATPAAQINAITDQNGFTLADAVTYEERRNQANGQQNLDGAPDLPGWNCGEEGPSNKRSVRILRTQQIANAFALLLFSQGVPMLYAGDEIRNSQDGNSNAWCQDNETGWVSWSRSAEARNLRAFVKDLISLRRAHPVLRQMVPLRGADYRGLGFPDLSFHNRNAWVGDGAATADGFGCLLFGDYVRYEDGTADDSFYIACNFSGEERALALPKPPGLSEWEIAVDTAYLSGEESRIPADAATIHLAPHSLRILRGIRR